MNRRIISLYICISAYIYVCVEKFLIKYTLCRSWKFGWTSKYILTKGWVYCFKNRTSVYITATVLNRFHSWGHITKNGPIHIHQSAGLWYGRNTDENIALFKYLHIVELKHSVASSLVHVGLIRSGAFDQEYLGLEKTLGENAFSNGIWL